MPYKKPFKKPFKKPPKKKRSGSSDNWKEKIKDLAFEAILTHYPHSESAVQEVARHVPNTPESEIRNYMSKIYYRNRYARKRYKEFCERNGLEFLPLAKQANIWRGLPVVESITDTALLQGKQANTNAQILEILPSAKTADADKDATFKLPDAQLAHSNPQGLDHFSILMVKIDDMAAKLESLKVSQPLPDAKQPITKNAESTTTPAGAKRKATPHKLPPVETVDDDASSMASPPPIITRRTVASVSAGLLAPTGSFKPIPPATGRRQKPKLVLEMGDLTFCQPSEAKPLGTPYAARMRLFASSALFSLGKPQDVASDVKPKYVDHRENKLATVASGWGGIFKGQENQWKCEVCSCMNDPKDIKCPSCETPRSGKEKEVAAADNQSSIASKGSIGAGGFSFAAAPVANVVPTTKCSIGSGGFSFASAPAHAAASSGPAVSFGTGPTQSFSFASSSSTTTASGLSLSHTPAPAPTVGEMQLFKFTVGVQQKDDHPKTTFDLTPAPKPSTAIPATEPVTKRSLHGDSNSYPSSADKASDDADRAKRGSSSSANTGFQFGSKATGMFGATPAPAAFSNPAPPAAPPTGFSFNSTVAPSSTPAGFGTTPAPSFRSTPVHAPPAAAGFGATPAPACGYTPAQSPAALAIFGGTPAPAFGSTPAQASAALAGFGSTPAPSFGSTPAHAPPAPGGFGSAVAPTLPAFGSTPLPSFGTAPAPAMAPAFDGSGSGGNFGAPSAGSFVTAPASFGAPVSGGFSDPAPFGAPTPAGFGAPAPQVGVVGGGFGAPPPASVDPGGIGN